MQKIFFERNKDEKKIAFIGGERYSISGIGDESIYQ